MNFLANYGLFLLQIITVVTAILATVLGVVVISSRGRQKKDSIVVKKINDRYDEMHEAILKATLDKKSLCAYHKKEKKRRKEKEKQQADRVYVLNFDGDIKASAVESLRQEVTALLGVAEAKDEIVVILESLGGLVSHYGLAAAQLQRIRDKQIPLTVCVDKVAASGGYLMACVANKILAAPFAIIGSIGVVAQLPNFHRWLKKHNVDFELITAGEYKRTLTVFGENTDQGRRKFKEDLELIHTVFKDFIAKHRPNVNIHEIATGEHWVAEKAFELRLVDSLKTSDDYLLAASQNDKELYEVCYQRKEPMLNKISSCVSSTVEQVIDKVHDTREPYQ